MNSELHNYDKILQGAINSISKNEKLSENNKNIILKFSDFCLSTGLTKVRTAKYIYTLGTIGKFLKMDFVDAKKDNIMSLMKEINLNNDYSEWTKKDFKVTLKKFYKWLRKTEDFPEEVKFLKTSVKNNRKKLPSELLTIEDIKKLSAATNNLRDRSIIYVLYELGARVGEFLPIRIKHVQFDQHGCLIMMHGKTGSRRIRCVASSPLLAKWLSIHPDRDNPNAFVWCGQSNTNKGEMLSYLSLRRLLDKLREKINLKKNVNPHNFRHSRATELAKILPEAQLCSIFGWEQGSDQPGTYVHLSQRDTDEAILKIHGLSNEDEQNSKQMKLQLCSRCKTKNSPDARFCESCGMALNIKTALNLKEITDKIDNYFTKILEDEDVKNLVQSKLKELMISKMD